MYTAAIKSVLGVRITTPNLLCFLEIGKPSLKSLIQSRQFNFFHRILTERKDMQDDPLTFALDLVKNSDIKVWKYIKSVIDKGADILQNDNITTRNTVIESQRTKFKTYLEINPTLETHSIYLMKENTIPEHYRQAFTRFRLSSHTLRVETGRWQRLIHTDRVCDCSENRFVQDERHVIENCKHLDLLRNLFPHLSFDFNDFMLQDPMSVCKYIYIAFRKLQHTH
jgi:hypothetical protein